MACNISCKSIQSVNFTETLFSKSRLYDKLPECLTPRKYTKCFDEVVEFKPISTQSCFCPTQCNGLLFSFRLGSLGKFIWQNQHVFRGNGFWWGRNVPHWHHCFQFTNFQIPAIRHTYQLRLSTIQVFIDNAILVKIINLMAFNLPVNQWIDVNFGYWLTNFSPN